RGPLRAVATDRRAAILRRADRGRVRGGESADPQRAVAGAAATSLERRPLGRTGLSVTPIGFGLAAVGRPGSITRGRDHDLGTDRSVEALERRSHQVLSAAYDAGIRYFDAARSYGFAERFLSSWLQLRRLTPGDLTVGSKWGYTYVGGWHVGAKVHEVKDHSLAALTRQITESRALLRAYRELDQIHSCTVDSWRLGVPGDR